MSEAEEQQVGEPTDESAGSFYEQRDLRFGIPDGYSLREPFKDFWPFILAEIAKTFGLGSFVITLVFFIFERPGLFSMSSAEILATIFGATIYGLLLFILASAATIVVVLVLYGLVFRTLFNCETLFIGVLVGGIVGLVLSVPLWPWQHDIYLINIAGMITVTLVGQIGGARGALKSLAWPRSAHGNLPSVDYRFQFSIRDLLIVTACLAALLTVLKWVHLLTLDFLIFICVWLGVQIPGLLIAFARDRKQQLRGTRDA